MPHVFLNYLPLFVGSWSEFPVGMSMSDSAFLQSDISGKVVWLRTIQSYFPRRICTTPKILGKHLRTIFTDFVPLRKFFHNGNMKLKLLVNGKHKHFYKWTIWSSARNDDDIGGTIGGTINHFGSVLILVDRLIGVIG